MIAGEGAADIQSTRPVALRRRHQWSARCERGALLAFGSQFRHASPGVTRNRLAAFGCAASVNMVR